MSSHWIQKVIRRDRKRQANSGRRKTIRRRLLLQTLTSRQLLAGDMMMDHMEPGPAAISPVADTGNSGHAAHPDDPARAAEHSAALALVDVAQATHTVVASGNWSDPGIWSDNTLPRDSARVHIPAGVSVTVDGVIPETLYTVRIDGTLRFDPNVDTELKVDTIVSSPMGRFEMGTAETPIDAGVTARVLVADTGEIDRAWDPTALSRGMVLHGETVINGAERNPWSTLDVAPVAGDLTITLSEQPDGWSVGDTIVIAGTKSDATGDEVRTIAGIDGNQVTLDQTLNEDHVPPKADLQVHVANTTRNAVIESQNQEVDRRGHVMFMHTRDVQVAHAGFYELGRTNKLEENDDSVLDEDGALVPGTGTNPRGRYSVHFHISGTRKDSPPATVVGSAVVGSPGWGYVNHSSYVDFVDNVSYDVDGAAFNTEVGDEVGSFVNNLSIRTHGTGGEPNEGQGNQDFGQAGDGFWFHGFGINAEGNVASGATGSGIIFYGETLIIGAEEDEDGDLLPGIHVPEYLVENLPDPSLLPGVTSIPTLMVPFSGVRNNTAYGSAKGFEVYKHRIGGLTPEQDQRLGVDSGFFANNPLGLPDGEIDGVTVWNSAGGVKLNYTADTHFKNVRVVNTMDQVGEVGFDATNVYNRGNHTYENFDIEGFQTGLFPSRGQTVVIDGGRFANGVDIDIPEVRQTHRRMEIRGDLRFEDLPSDAPSELTAGRQNLVMQADMRDLVDGNVTWFLLNDRVILNYGDFGGEQIYYSDQAADQVLFAEQPDQVVPDDPGFGIPEQFIGLTNAELQSQYMTSFGGMTPPEDAVDAPGDGIVGLIGTATGEAELPPPTSLNDVPVVPGIPGFDTGEEEEDEGEDSEDPSEEPDDSDEDAGGDVCHADFGEEEDGEAEDDAEMDMDEMTMTPSSHAGGMTHHMAHESLMALVDPVQATHTVVASGNWSDPSVWQNGQLPTAGARIVVPDGMTLTVDSMIAEEFKTVRIDGLLRFATDVDTELRVDTLVSSPTGKLEIGTAANPIADGATARVVFADDGAIDRNWDPTQISRGAILQGPVEIQGSATTHQVALATHPAAGAGTLELASLPVGWNVGDRIIITGTNGSTSDEIRTIRSIDGATVTLDQPLQQDHIPPKADLNVYVANTTRNVQFTSENSELAHRGHVMFMHQLDVRVSNASFEDLGRTDKTRPLDDIFFEFTDDAVGNETSAGTVFTTSTGPANNIRGRYPVHFHRGGNSPGSTPAEINGSVVMRSPGWGFVNHSANVDMVNNVAYGVHGASFYTEAGDEIGSMVGNLAIRTVSPTFTLGDGGAIDPDLRADVQDFGVDGDGFWLSGHMVSLRDNIAAGASGHGMIIWSDGLVESDTARGRASVRVADVANGDLITGRDTIPTWWAPMAEISNNESFGATIGFRSRYVHSSVYLGETGSAFHTPPDQAYIDTLNPVVDGLTVWGSRDGVLLNYNERLSIRNARLIGTGAPYVRNGGTADTGVGIDMYNEVSRGPGVIENVSIEGFNMGLLAPRHDEWTVNNLQLSNTTDMLITEPRVGGRVLEMNNVTFGSLDGTAVAGNEGQRQNIVMDADLEPDGFQPYYFLLPDRITLDGQGLYFDQQAADFVPLPSLDAGELIAPVSNEFVGLTNQQLSDTYGTSFGGAIIPNDATSVSYVSGGVVGSLSPPPATSPPLYDMTGEASAGIIIDPGTLTNFSGAVPGGGDGDDGEGDEGDGDPGDDDSEEQDPDDDGEEGEDEEGEDSDEEEDGEDTDADMDEEDGEDSEEDDSESDDEEGEDSDDEDGEADGEGGDEHSCDSGSDDEDEGGEDSDDEGEEDEDSGGDDTETDDEDEEGDAGGEDPDNEGEEDEDSGGDDTETDDEDEEADADNEDSDDEAEEDEDSGGDDTETDDEDEEGDADGEAPDDEGDEDEDSGEDEPESDDEDEEGDAGGEDSDDEGEDDEDGEDSSGVDPDTEDEDGSPGQFQNPTSPTDVNGDGVTSASDALMVINFLSTHESGLLRAIADAILGYIDVNGDDSASASDVLAVINFLSRLDAGLPEGETVDSRSMAMMDFADDDDAEEIDEEILRALATNRLG